MKCKTTGAEADGGKPSGQKRKSELQEAITRAKKQRMELGATMSQASTLLQNIQKDPIKWGWASHIEFSGQIHDIKAKDDFAREILSVSELSELKGQESRNDSALATLLNTFSDFVEANVSTLSHECKVLLAQQRARLSV